MKLRRLWKDYVYTWQEELYLYFIKIAKTYKIDFELQICWQPMAFNLPKMHLGIGGFEHYKIFWVGKPHN